MQGDSVDLGHLEALNLPTFGLELRHSIRSLVEEAGRRSRGLGRLCCSVQGRDLSKGSGEPEFGLRKEIQKHRFD